MGIAEHQEAAWTLIYRELNVKPFGRGSQLASFVFN